MSDEGREVSANWLFDNFGKWLPMSRCVELAESHRAALAAAGFKVLAREPTEVMMDTPILNRDCVRKGDVPADKTWRASRIAFWRTMWDAATPGAQP